MTAFSRPWPPLAQSLQAGWIKGKSAGLGEDGIKPKEAEDCREEAWGSHTGRQLTRGRRALQEAPVSGSVGPRDGLGTPHPSPQVGPDQWLRSSTAELEMDLKNLAFVTFRLNVKCVSNIKISSFFLRGIERSVTSGCGMLRGGVCITVGGKGDLDLIQSVEKCRRRISTPCSIFSVTGGLA